MPRPTPKSLRAKLRRVRLLLCDVDGVLTDASVFLGLETEFKRFNIQDGLGIGLARRCGLRVGWVSNRPSAATTQRAVELKIDYLSQDKGGKVASVEAILRQAGLNWDQVCFVGDDIVDLGALRRAGVAVSVPNGTAEVRAAAHYVTRRAGGQGAVREVIEMILRAQNKWTPLVREHAA